MTRKIFWYNSVLEVVSEERERISNLIDKSLMLAEAMIPRERKNENLYLDFHNKTSICNEAKFKFLQDIGYRLLT